MKDEFYLMAVGSALLIVSKAHKLQAYDDLVCSVLLAQLVASKKVEKESGQDWYDAYVSVLDDFWLRSSRARQDEQVSVGITKTPLQWLGDLNTAAKLVKGQLFVEALGQAASIKNTELALSVMQPHMENPVEDESSTVPLLKDVHMLVILATTPTSFDSVYLAFTTRQQTSFTPWERFQGEDLAGPVCIRTARANLAETLYKPVRDGIALKVRDRMDGNVVHLDNNNDELLSGALFGP